MIQNYMSGPRARCINGESAVFQKRNRFPTRMSTKLNKQQPAFLKKDMSKLLQNSDSRICANLSIPCMYDHEGTFLVNWIINIHAKNVFIDCRDIIFESITYLIFSFMHSLSSQTSWRTLTLRHEIILD